MNTAKEMEIREAATAHGLAITDKVVEVAAALKEVMEEVQEAGRATAARGAAAEDKSILTGFTSKLLPNKEEHAAALADILDAAYMDGYQETGRFLVVSVTDNSMEEKRICSGDQIVVDTTAPIENGCIVWAKADGAYIIRQYSREGDKITLSPMTKDTSYRPAEYKAGADNIQIIGRAVTVRIAA